MNWGSWSEFFAMGGYGFYVWGSYLVTFVFMAVEIVLLIQRKHAIQRQLGGGAR